VYVRQQKAHHKRLFQALSKLHMSWIPTLAKTAAPQVASVGVAGGRTCVCTLLRPDIQQNVLTGAREVRDVVGGRQDIGYLSGCFDSTELDKTWASLQRR